MSESMLNTFIRFIAGVCAVRTDVSTIIVRKYLETYIESNYGKRLVKQCVNSFDVFLKGFSTSENQSLIIHSICKAINKEFSLTQRFQLIINLLNFFSFSTSLVSRVKPTIQPADSRDDLDTIATWLRINPIDFSSFRLFSSGQLHNISNRENLLIVSEVDPKISGTAFIPCKGIKGFITFLYLKSTDLLLFIYNGQSMLEINGKPIYSKHTYILSSGSVITGKDVSPIYYGNIIKTLVLKIDSQPLTLTAQNISYNYSKSSQGINNLSLSTTRGELMGIMGGSGVGKSTLVKILSGGLKPQIGEVLVNGQNIYHLNRKDLCFIGVMHQEECLVEELSVYENLYYSAKLSIGNASDSQIVKLVNEKLFELDLNGCKDNRVGTPDNRQLSGGQRKRLAIAMEIIRKPKVLFVDEPTSGLSSADSLLVMKILKNIALTGTLVIVNIHQPSSDIYKLFNSIIIIDRGGIPVFYGDPAGAILHFKSITDKVDKDISACECCGTIKPEQIFELLEEHQIDEMGQVLHDRKLNPLDWSEIFHDKVKSNPIQTPEKIDLPKIEYNLPLKTLQFTTFFVRNLISKLRNKQYLFFSLILPPILSTVISIFLRYSIAPSNTDMSYSLYANPNLPSFFLMAILSSLFFGLIISCEDIIRDRRIINREGVIGLSLKSYLNAKFSFLVILSAIQTISFALPGLLIVEIKGFVFSTWLILFLLSIFGNLTGLILSSSLKSVVAIYILIPFLLIPQILFSGLVVPFDNLNSKFSSHSHVPIIGDIMPSRWASEAIMVNFFMQNKYSKPFFSHNFSESELRFRLLYLLPELKTLANKLANNPDSINEQDIELLKSGFVLLYNNSQEASYVSHFEPWTEKSIHPIVDLIDAAQKEIANSYTKVKYNRDRAIESIYPNTDEGRRVLNKTKRAYHNGAIEALVTNSHHPAPLMQLENSYVQKSDPIYQLPSSSIGRAHFLAPYKKIGGFLLETYWFAVVILLIMIFFGYLTYMNNFFPKLLNRITK